MKTANLATMKHVPCATMASTLMIYKLDANHVPRWCMAVYSVTLLLFAYTAQSATTLPIL
jgi:hypothetical protein